MTKQYLFDSNIFIGLERKQPLDLYPSLWNKIGELMDAGIIVSSREVYDEIASGSDEIASWIKKHSESFLPSEEPVQEEVRSILRQYRGLVEGGKKKNSADPFVIGLAKCQGYVVVTDETPTHNLESPKIPDVCDQLNIPCCDFVAFMRELKLQV